MILQSGGGLVEKPLANKLCLAIDTRKQAKISTRDFIYFMKQVDGKYNSDRVWAKLA